MIWVQPESEYKVCDHTTWLLRPMDTDKPSNPKSNWDTVKIKEETEQHLMLNYRITHLIKIELHKLSDLKALPL